MRRPGESEQVPRQVGGRGGPEALGRGRRDRGLVLRVEGGPQAVERRLGRAGLGLPERRESRRDPRAHPVHLAKERIGSVVSQRSRDALDHRGIARDAVRLLARRELHAVLQPAQEEVRVGELALLALGDEAARAEAPQRLDGVGSSHARLEASPDKLQALREELHLADPALADLEVVVRADPRLGPGPTEHRAHLVDDARVDRAAPDERRQRGEQLFTEGVVSGDGPRAHERRPLPGPAPGLVVTLGGGQRVDERPARPFGAQPEVDAPYDAVLGRLVQRRDHPLRDPREVLVQRVSSDRRGRRHDEAVVRLVEEHQVDVAPRVELAPAQLAHTDDGECAGRSVGRDRRPETSLGPGLRLGERDLAAHVRQIGELA